MKQGLHIPWQKNRYRQHFLKFFLFLFFNRRENRKKITNVYFCRILRPIVIRGPWPASGLLGTLCRVSGLARCGHLSGRHGEVSCHLTASRLSCHDSHLRLCLLWPPTQLPFWSEVRDSPWAVCSYAWRPFLIFSFITHTRWIASICTHISKAKPNFI